LSLAKSNHASKQHNEIVNPDKLNVVVDSMHKKQNSLSIFRDTAESNVGSQMPNDITMQPDTTRNALPSPKYPKESIAPVTLGQHIVFSNTLFRIFCLSKITTKNKKEQELTIFYISLIGYFMTAGIFLDISCVYSSEYCLSQVNLGIFPLICALLWLLISKVILNSAILPIWQLIVSNKVKYKKRQSTEENDCTTLLEITYLFMFVIFICGVIAISIYSYKFDVFLLNNIINNIK
jgi:hypothetical protein